MTTYRIADEIVEKNSPDWQAALSECYRTKVRPQCMCRHPGIPMYVIFHEQQYYVKRMPNMGQEHSPSCGSYEPPAELSGLGEVLGTAIVESNESPFTQLKLDFTLNKRSPRTIPEGISNAHDSAHTDGKKLSLRALLHYLWEQAGFHRWSPAMRGKRHWSVIRHHLLCAMQDKESKGIRLSEVLYIPEQFVLHEKSAIASRRANTIASALQTSTHTKARKLAILIAEVKDIVPARYGYKLIAKNLPDYPFGIAYDLQRRISRRFSSELSLWDSVDDAHLIAIATFSVNQADVANIDEIALMATTDAWLPFESLHEKLVIDRLVQYERRFFKGLRYNLHDDRPLATAVLVDTNPPTTMYLRDASDNPQQQELFDSLIADSKFPAWIWSPHHEDMPALPTTKSL